MVLPPPLSPSKETMHNSPAEDGVEECCSLNSNPNAAVDGVLGESALRLGLGAGSSQTPGPDEYDWCSFRDDDILHQQSNILEEEAEKMPCVGEKVRYRGSWSPFSGI